VHRSQNGIAFAAFPHSTQNKSQTSGMFLSSTQRTVVSPQQPRNQPQLHHKNTTSITRFDSKHPSKSLQNYKAELPKKNVKTVT
jgi:hypothetical protein